jgi:hypothetical protein
MPDSAGGHIALMLAVNAPHLTGVGVDRMRLKGVIGISGPHYFLPLTVNNLLDIFGGPNNPGVETITFVSRAVAVGLAGAMHGRLHGLSAQCRVSRRRLTRGRRPGRTKDLRGNKRIGLAARTQETNHDFARCDAVSCR